MMRLAVPLGVATVLLTTLAASADELKSGLQPGQSVGFFNVVKCGGAPDDGVKVGQTLCYRWRLGQKPVVMVFARKPDAALTSLVKQLDEVLPKHADKKLSSFVNLVGTDREILESQAKELADKNQFKNVPIVVPLEFEDGPKDFGVNPKAEVTVTLYVGRKVVSSHALAPGKLDQKAVDAILADIPKIVP